MNELQALSGGSVVLLAIVFVARVAVDFVKWLVERSHTIEDRLRFETEVYERMDALKAKVLADRVHVSTVSNGGGIPTNDSPIYITVTHETYENDLNELKSQWQRRVPSRFHSRVLLEVRMSDGPLVLETRDVPKGDALTTELREGGTSFVVICGAKVTQKKFTYVVVHFHKPGARAQVARIRHEVRAFAYWLGGRLPS